jgi:dienelactone hydrolase
MIRRLVLVTAVGLVALACGSSATTGDAGTIEDSGSPLIDAGSTIEASARDVVVEASAPRADVPNIPCNDAIGDVYVTPNNLPTMTNSTRGDIVRCAFDFSLPLPTVQSQVASKGLVTTMTTSVNVYRIAFRTYRGNGSAGVSTARVYLPQTPAALPLPVLVAAHPTDGIADSTAPSMDATSNEDLALPWAGLGDAIIVPDYAGLGNEGVQGYLDNHDQAHSVLDGARALRKFVSQGALSNQVGLIGYSQGGGAVLSAQALASTYGDGDLAFVIAFAPEWPTRPNSFGFVNMLENPSELTIETGISYCAVEVMRAYAYFANYVGMPDADDGYPSASRSGFDSAVNSMNEVVLGGYIQGVAPTIGGFIDPGFRTSLLACIQNGANDPGCVAPGKSFYTFMQNDFVTNDPNGAKVLFVQGLADYVMPAPLEGACNVDKLVADGVTPQVCVDAPAQHTDVVGRNTDFALTWAKAMLTGQTPPACTADGVMPPCVP